MIRTNSYAGHCCVCRAEVAPSEGYLYPRDEAIIEALRTGERAWLTLCKSPACYSAFFGRIAPASGASRALLDDGTIVLPAEDPSLVPYLRAIATLEVADGRSRWRALADPGMRPHVLDVAAKLGLDVAPSWVACELPPNVREHVARAEQLGAFGHQRDGVAWLVTQSTSPNVRGCLLADDMGLGKTFQILRSLPADRGLVVVAPKSVVGVWPDQIARWCPDRFDSVRIVAHHSEFAWPSSPRECVVLHYEALPYSKAMIANERVALIVKRDGRPGKATAKKKAEREPVVGLVTQLERAERTFTAATTAATTATREQLSAMLGALVQTSRLADARSRKPKPAQCLALTRAVIAELLAEPRDKLAAQVKRNEQALARNAKLHPPGKPPCNVQLVIDEAHRTASGGTKRTTAVRALAKQARFTIGVTGTPVEDDPFLLQSLLTTCQCNPFDRDLLLWGFNASRLPHGGYEFDRHPGIDGMPGPIIVRPGIPELLRRVMLRRRSNEVLDLPPRIFAEVPVPIDDKLRAELDELAADPEVKALVLAGELPTFGRISQVRTLLASALIPTMLEMVEEYEATREPVVVFSEHVAPIEALRKRRGWGVINGNGSTLHGAKSTSDEVVAAMQRGELHGIAATIASLQEGVTLTRARRMLFVDLSYSRRSNEQAFKRCHRPGQQQPVVITVLTPDHPITRHVTSVLTRKDQFAASVIDAPSEPAPRVSTPLPKSLVSDATPEESERWANARARVLGLAVGEPGNASTIEADAAAWARREAREAHALAVLRRLLPGARAGLPAALGQARAVLGL